MRNKNNHNETKGKGSGEVIWPHSTTYSLSNLYHWPRVF